MHFQYNKCLNFLDGTTEHRSGEGHNELVRNRKIFRVQFSLSKLWRCFNATYDNPKCDRHSSMELTASWVSLDCSPSSTISWRRFLFICFQYGNTRNSRWKNVDKNSQKWFYPGRETLKLAYFIYWRNKILYLDSIDR